MEELQVTPKYVKLGRPPLPNRSLRIQISSTISYDDWETLKKNNWAINELIKDGIEHRENCGDMYKKISAYQQLITELQTEIDLLRVKL